MKPRFRFAQHLSSASTVVLLLGGIASTSMAHEPTQTHRRLAIAAFELFQANSDYDFLAEEGIEPIDVELELGLGVMEDDRCIETDDLGLPWYDFANFYNHFWNPASNTNKGAPFGGDTSLFRNPIQCANGNGDTEWELKNAKLRAAELYELALEHHRRGTPSGRQRAYRILGRVLHLLGDMTSPAHVHNDPHGHLDFVGDDLTLADCSFDIDDVETWGFCQRPSGETSHIFDYFRYESERLFFYQPETGQTPVDIGDINSFVPCEGLDGFGCSSPEDTVAPYRAEYKFPKITTQDCDGFVPPPGFTCRLWETVNLLHDGEPRSVEVKDGNHGRPTATHGPDENSGEAFIRRVAEITYDFSTYRVALTDTANFSADDQPDSELNRMLRPATTGADDCSGFVNDGLCDDVGDYEIFGSFQSIGRTEGECGRAEWTFEIFEEWWVMEHGCSEPDGLRCDHRPDISCSVPLINCAVGGSRLCSETRRDCDLNPLNGNECPDIRNRCENTDFFGKNGRCSATNRGCDLNPLNGNECPDFIDTCLERGVCSDNYTTVCAKGAIPSDCPGATNVCVDDYGLCLPYQDISGYAYIENAGGEGRDGEEERDNFVPLRFGCELTDSSCGEAGQGVWPAEESHSRKSDFETLYGSHSNQEDALPCPGETESAAPCPTSRRGKTLLRIYGDVLYANAVAYGAGLIETFVIEVPEPSPKSSAVAALLTLFVLARRKKKLVRPSYRDEARREADDAVLCRNSV